jgi:putative ABC transport system ATP-binding protein
MSELLVAAEAVGMTYGRGAAAVGALDGVSVKVRRGEMLLILGPSGSGKTTLLQILGALIRPTAGRVSVAGQPIDGLSARGRARLRLEFFGFVFQDHNLLPTLNAWENVAVALDLKGIRGPAAERRSRALLDEVGLASRAEAYPAELSGGQKQRVAVARAVALDPAVVLADEPTASLDSASGWQVVQLLRGPAVRQGRAVVVVTHDHRLLAAGDRAIALDDGRIAAVPAVASDGAGDRS